MSNDWEKRGSCRYVVGSRSVLGVFAIIIIFSLLWIALVSGCGNFLGLAGVDYVVSRQGVRQTHESGMSKFSITAETSSRCPTHVSP